MARKKETETAEPRKIVAPDSVLEKLAKLPEDVQQLALGYGYGLMVGRKLKDA